MSASPARIRSATTARVRATRCPRRTREDPGLGSQVGRDHRRRSGAFGDQLVHRQGFKTLLAEIGSGQVGIVLGLEASRLSRSSADWHRLAEICAVTQTLLADESAVYDPRDPNDRLLLGVKGTISEAEIFTLRTRLHEGRWNKARRGELARSLPVGYVKSGPGAVIKDPDLQIQSRLAYIFRLFTRHKVARQILVQLVREKLQVPAKIWGGPRHGQVTWKEPELSDVIRLLHNPTYAGAYVYGRRTTTRSTARRPMARPGCIRYRWRTGRSAFLAKVYPAYITWEEFVKNQETLQSKMGMASGNAGPPGGARPCSKGSSTAAGGAVRMSVLYYSTKEKRAPGYGCFYEYKRHGGETCQCFSSAGVDAAVAGLFLHVVSPAKIEIALQALEEVESDHAEACQQWDLQLRRADYEVELGSLTLRGLGPGEPAGDRGAGEPWEGALRQRERLLGDCARSSIDGRSTPWARRIGSRSESWSLTWAGSGRWRRRRWRTARRWSVS